MAPPEEKLASSIAILRDLQKDGRLVFQSSQLSRVHRERLLKHGLLREVIKGWLVEGGLDAWNASFWEFCGRYADERFGDQWHVSAELSLMLHAGKNGIPGQVVIHTLAGTNNKILLPFGASLYDLKQPALPPPGDLAMRERLRVFTPAAALIRVPEAFYTAHTEEARSVLGVIRDSSDLRRRLLDGGHSVVAGRLAGALRALGRNEAADDIVTTMKAAGYDVRESDPFADRSTGTGMKPMTKAQRGAA